MIYALAATGYGLIAGLIFMYCTRIEVNYRIARDSPPRTRAGMDKLIRKCAKDSIILGVFWPVSVIIFLLLGIFILPVELWDKITISWADRLMIRHNGLPDLRVSKEVRSVSRPVDTPPRY